MADDTVQTWVHRADHLLERRQQNEEALEALEEALRLDPTNVDALRKRSLALTALGRFAENLDVCAQVLELEPQRAISWALYAFALQGVGHHERALDTIDHCIKLMSDDLQLPKKREDEGKTSGTLAMAWERDKKTSILAAKGASLLALRRYEDALAALNEALALDPTNQEALRTKASVYYRQGRYEEELALIEILLQD